MSEETYSNGRYQYRDCDEKGTAKHQYEQAYKELEQKLMRKGYEHWETGEWYSLWADGFEAFEGIYYDCKAPSVRLSEHGKTSIVKALKASKIEAFVGDACDTKWGESSMDNWWQSGGTRLYHTIPVTNAGLLGLAGKVTLSVTTFYSGLIDVALTVNDRNVSPHDHTLISFWGDEDGISVRDDVDRKHPDVVVKESWEYDYDDEEGE